jgi:hypothetical protein
MDPFEFLREIAVFQGFLRGPADIGREQQRSGSVKLVTSHRPRFDAKPLDRSSNSVSEGCGFPAKPAISMGFLGQPLVPKPESAEGEGND